MEEYKNRNKEQNELLQPTQNPPTTTHTKKRKQSHVDFEINKSFHYNLENKASSMALASVKSVHTSWTNAKAR